jgi:cyclohexanone monooxygenase
MQNSSTLRHGAEAARFDAVVVGAGFAGLYMLHRLHRLGLSVRVYDEATKLWQIDTDRGERSVARFCIMATGALSAARRPDIAGLDVFGGKSFHTGFWPHEPVDFSGERVAVIGTGSSGIQTIPVVAAQAAHLTVFQRTPNFSIPAWNAPLSSVQQVAWKADYAKHRARARTTRSGTLYEYSTRSAWR